jgi:hypothetical protein
MMKRPMTAVLAALMLLAAVVATPAFAADDAGAKDAAKDDFSKLPPFPAD